MKTLIYNWLHRSWRALLLLLLFNLSFSSVNYLAAQVVEDGEAFYIYRNDGDFDGFFYDEVSEMRYSKVGVDNQEYNDYVTYEVVTADSTFRIPLAAIDSIGFVQPEFKFGPRTRHMDILGITPYITSAGQSALTFSPSLPSELMPKEGDVLIGFTGLLEDKGFGGRVVEVHNYGSSIEVTCEKLDKMSDIFEQFISIEQVGSRDNGAQQVRRMAGYNKLMKSASRISEGGTVNLTLVNISINGHFPFIPDFGVPSNPFLNADINGSFVMRMKTFYQITNNDYLIKIRLNEDYSLQVGASMGIGGSDFVKVPLLEKFGIKFPTGIPLFEVRPAPELGVRYSGSFGANLTFPVKSGHMHQTFIIDSDKRGVSYQGSESEQQPAESAPSNPLCNIEAGVTVSGMAQFGIKQPLKLFTNSWLESILGASIGMDLYLGPKIDGSLAISASDLIKGNGLYSLKDNRFSLHLLDADYEVGVEYTDAIMHPNVAKWQFADGSFSMFFPLDFYMFPSFDMKKADFNPKKYQVEAEITTDGRRVFMPSEHGIGLLRYSNWEPVIIEYKSQLAFGDVAPDSIEATFPTKDIDPGKYYVVPCMKVLGGDVPVKSVRKEVEIPPYLELSQDTVKAAGKSNDYKIFFETNGQGLLAAVASRINWLKTEVVYTSDKTGYIDVKVQDSPEIFEREAQITVSVNSGIDDIITSQEVRVIQNPGAKISKAEIGLCFSCDDPQYPPYDAEGGGLYPISLPAINVHAELVDSVWKIAGEQAFDKDYIKLGGSPLKYPSYTYGGYSSTSSAKFECEIKKYQEPGYIPTNVLSGSINLVGNTRDALDEGDHIQTFWTAQYDYTTSISAEFDYLWEQRNNSDGWFFSRDSFNEPFTASGSEVLTGFSKEYQILKNNAGETSIWTTDDRTFNKTVNITNGISIGVKLIYGSVDE